MSINLSNFRTGVFKWVEAELASTPVTSDKIVWLSQDAPRPERPYVGMDFLTGPGQIGHDEARETAPGVFDITGNRNLTLTVSVYGEGADSIACQLHSSLEKISAREILSGYGISLVRQEDVRDISIKLDTRIETRYQFDAVFRVVSSVSDDVGFVETVELTDEINDTTTVIES